MQTIISLCLFVLLPPSGWEAKTPMPKGVAFPLKQPVAINGRIYVATGSWGGVNGTVYEYDPKAEAWFDRNAPMPTRRHHYAVVTTGGRLFAVGGCTGETDNDRHAPTAAFEEYDPATGAWRARAPLPEPRRNASVAALGGKIYVFGGENEANPNLPLAIYEVATDRWIRTTITADIAMWAAAQVLNGRIYLIGNAREGNAPRTLEFDPGTRSFSSKAPFKTARGAFGSAVANGWIYLLGGRAGDKWVADAERYNPEADRWEQAPELPKPAGYPGVVALEGHIFLLGGVTDTFANPERTLYQLR